VNHHAFPANPHPSPGEVSFAVLQKAVVPFGTSEAFKLMDVWLVRLVSFFQKIPGTKIILQFLGKKIRKNACPNAGQL